MCVCVYDDGRKREGYDCVHDRHPRTCSYMHYNNPACERVKANNDHVGILVRNAVIVARYFGVNIYSYDSSFFLAHSISFVCACIMLLLLFCLTFMECIKLPQ